MSLSSIFQDIADAIRTKTGKSESIYPIDMASEIEGIESGGGYKLEKMPSGAVSSFNDGTDLPLNKLKVSIEPVQDLHGYDAPWVGGAGKNKSPVNSGEIKSGDFVTFSTPLPSGNYAISFKVTRTGSDSRQAQFVVYDKNGTTYNSYGFDITTSRVERTLNATNGISRMYFYSIGGSWGESQNFTLTLTDFQVEDGNTATAFEPYSNICPIIGWDEVNVTVANDVDNPTVSNVYTIDLDGTRYGGTLDVVSGVLTVTNANIVSYNGEIINEPWISSMDVYSAGATPATGAQVVYPLATPQTIQLAPTAVRSLIELNNIWTDTGDIINGEYFKEAGTRPTS